MFASLLCLFVIRISSAHMVKDTSYQTAGTAAFEAVMFTTGLHLSSDKTVYMAEAPFLMLPVPY